MKTLLVLVPARAGSKRLPGKNMRRMAGKSLLAHTADALRESGLEAPVLLSTDAADIAEEGQRLGWLTPFTRPAALATDDASSVDVALHALDRWTDEYGYLPEYLLLLQPTSPLRGGACMVRAIDMLDRQADADAVVACTAAHVGLSSMFVVGDDGFLVAPFADRQAPAIHPNGALYLVRTSVLQRKRTFVPARSLALVMDRLRSVDIDTPEDFALAEAIVAAGLLDDEPPRMKPGDA